LKFLFDFLLRGKRRLSNQKPARFLENLETSKGESPMKNTIKKVARAANRKLKKFKDALDVNLRLPIIQVLLETQWQVEQLASAAGLKVIECAIAEEVRQRTGERYEHDQGEAYRWGSQRGYAMFAGRKVPIEKPRVRSKKTGREIELNSYRQFQQDIRLEQAVMDQMALGLSTRHYEPSIRALCEGYGIKKSSVSRRFITASKKALDELMSRDIGKLDLCVLFIDGVERAGQCLIIAVGVDRQGMKHCLGLWQGATENATVAKALLQDLIRRGLSPEKRYLFIIDGAKSLSSAVRKTFAAAEIQRCQLHKRRNVRDHLPETHQADVDRRIRAAYQMKGYAEAKAELEKVVRYLDGLNPSAARSLEEGMEETLTLHRLGIPDQLRTSLNTTNIIESSLSRVDHLLRRVKRWNGGDHVQRWAATALLQAEKGFRKVKGFREMDVLIRVLNRKAPDSKKVAA
jgi:transposase-like protein